MPASSSVDPLGDALHALRVDGVFYCRSELTAPWTLVLPARTDAVMFHVVTTGACTLDVKGQPPVALERGDLALVPHGRGHRLASSPPGPVGRIEAVQKQRVSERFGILRHGGGGAMTVLICGAVTLGHPSARRLTALLPEVITSSRADDEQSEWLASALRFMAAEARTRRPGGEAVMTRLADILVIQAIRGWIESAPAAKRGWLAALQDPQIGRAIAALHGDPLRAWTIAEVAGEVGMSRSAFAARFKRFVGEGAMHYVTRVRMDLALSQLRDDESSLAAIAERFGYESEAAFNRAFKRMNGVTPGVARKRADVKGWGPSQPTAT